VGTSRKEISEGWRLEIMSSCLGPVTFTPNKAQQPHTADCLDSPPPPTTSATLHICMHAPHADCHTYYAVDMDILPWAFAAVVSEVLGSLPSVSQTAAGSTQNLFLTLPGLPPYYHNAPASRRRPVFIPATVDRHNFARLLPPSTPPTPPPLPPVWCSRGPWRHPSSGPPTPEPASLQCHPARHGWAG
jgi:hypothetical protein